MVRECVLWRFLSPERAQIRVRFAPPTLLAVLCSKRWIPLLLQL